MTVSSIYPVLLTSDVSDTADFYARHLGFDVTFRSDWYVSLKRGAHELAILDRDHDTVPENFRGASASGILLNIEVDDVDSEYERLVLGGPLDALVSIRSEGFGQRHFIVAGPDGVLVDVITPIEPSAAFAQQFTQ